MAKVVLQLATSWLLFTPWMPSLGTYVVVQVSTNGPMKFEYKKDEGRCELPSEMSSLLDTGGVTVPLSHTRTLSDLLSSVWKKIHNRAMDCNQKKRVLCARWCVWQQLCFQPQPSPSTCRWQQWRHSYLCGGLSASREKAAIISCLKNCFPGGGLRFWGGSTWK